MYEARQNLREFHITLIVLLFLHQVLYKYREYLVLKLFVREVLTLHSLNGYIHGFETNLNVRIGK
jgi:hypothetical protein